MGPTPIAAVGVEEGVPLALLYGAAEGLPAQTKIERLGIGRVRPKHAERLARPVLFAVVIAIAEEAPSGTDQIAQRANGGIEIGGVLW